MNAIGALHRAECRTNIWREDLDEDCSQGGAGLCGPGRAVRRVRLRLGMGGRLLGAHGEGMEALWARLSSTDEVSLKALIESVGSGSLTLDKNQPLCTLRVSKGRELSVLGLSISHILADGHAYYNFFDLICRAYSCESRAQLAALPPLPHLDNVVHRSRLPTIRLWRTSLNCWQHWLRSVQVGICCARMGCGFLPCCLVPQRVFSLRITKAQAAAAKQAIAARHPELPAPLSVNDALCELFAPDPASGTFNFSIHLDVRGRINGAPALTSGNASVLISKAVHGGGLTHGDVRAWLNEWRTPQPVSALAVLRGREWGWNSWASVSRDGFMSTASAPTLVGLELLVHEQRVRNIVGHAHICAGHGLVWAADEAGTLALQLEAVDPAHAWKVQQACKELGLAYRCTDETRRVRSTSDDPEQLYDTDAEYRI
ncbi:hypothetical protein CYMTET_16192 [Cymbomonas tetramitiformis]|uniref:Uncharacterized protein n=1 Tax=Cymbomonas tetramitiformis TaxID=36881 RepID=A0AAE0GD37_9CHLO|nr:hypothetical protein CYMTET_16192 [Cymbomonas tetramitiformis]